MSEEKTEVEEAGGTENNGAQRLSDIVSDAVAQAFHEQGFNSAPVGALKLDGEGGGVLQLSVGFWARSDSADDAMLTVSQKVVREYFARDTPSNLSPEAAYEEAIDCLKALRVTLGG